MATVKEARAKEKLVGEVLYWVWDPIGVNYTFDARDEYDGYALQLVRILDEDLEPEIKEDKLVNFLHDLCRNQIGVGTLDNCRRAAERLMDLSDPKPQSH